MDVLLRGNMKSGQKKIPYSPSLVLKQLSFHVSFLCQWHYSSPSYLSVIRETLQIIAHLPQKVIGNDPSAYV